MLELRKCSQSSTLDSSESAIQTSSLSAFHATVGYMCTTVEQDFGEPLYPVLPMPSSSGLGSQDIMHAKGGMELSEICQMNGGNA